MTPTKAQKTVLRRLAAAERDLAAASERREAALISLVALGTTPAVLAIELGITRQSARVILNRRREV